MISPLLNIFVQYFHLIHEFLFNNLFKKNILMYFIVYSNLLITGFMWPTCFQETVMLREKWKRVLIMKANHCIDQIQSIKKRLGARNDTFAHWTSS